MNAAHSAVLDEQQEHHVDLKQEFQSIHDAFCFAYFTPDGDILDANHNFLEAVGYTLEEIKHKHHRMLIDKTEADSKKYQQFWKDLQQGKSYNDVFRRIGKDDKEIWLRGLYAAQKDESGSIVGVVTVLTDITSEKHRELDIMRKVEMILDVMLAAEQGDLRKEISVEGSEPIDLVCNSIKKFLTSLRSSIGNIAKSTELLMGSAKELSSVSEEMAKAAEETSTQSNKVANLAESVSTNIQTVSSSAEELNSSIRAIAKNTEDAVQVANQAVAFTDEATQTMAKLGESSTQIGNVIKIITSIAQQTNLLALNATIEAARAGEAGKGFAVVANEVKELAKETARATEDISHRIESIQNDTKDCLGAILKVSNIIKEINVTQNTIAAAVEEQSTTTSQIGHTVAEAASDGMEISTNIVRVAQNAKNTSLGVTSNQGAANELALMISELQEIVAQFIYR